MPGALSLGASLTTDPLSSSSGWKYKECEVLHLLLCFDFLVDEELQLFPYCFFFCFCFSSLVQMLPHFSMFLVFSLFIDSSNIHYFGNSYLEFEGFELKAINTITVSFQSESAQGTIIYVDQGPANGDFFFMKLFILDGVLQVKPTPLFWLFFFKLPILYCFLDIILVILSSSTMFQYAFCCNEDEEFTLIISSVPVNDGDVHVVNIR